MAEPWSVSRQTPLTHSFCQHVVVSEGPLRVEDARRDPRVCTSAAIGDLNVIAYLGTPIRAASGHILGSLCAIDTSPREWTADDETTLADVAVLVEEQIRTTQNEQKWRSILDVLPQMVWSARPDGYVDFYNDRWYEFTGVSHGATNGEAWDIIVHPDDRAEAVSRWRDALQTGRQYDVEYRLRHSSGEYRWALGRALPIKDGEGKTERWFGTCTDIQELKKAEAQRDLLRRELAHRIQNIFAVTTGIIAIAARSRPEMREFAQTLSRKIQALAAANRFVVPDNANESSDKTYTLHSLIRAIVGPYFSSPDDPANLVIEGHDLPLQERNALTSFALVLHELVTNSVKYGSLSAGGTVSISTDDLRDRFRLIWRETGGPRIEEVPTRCGFGSRLVGTLLSQIDGRIDRRWEPTGLIATIEARTL